jgi:hypothetical protein
MTRHFKIVISKNDKKLAITLLVITTDKIHSSVIFRSRGANAVTVSG